MRRRRLRQVIELDGADGRPRDRPRRGADDGERTATPSGEPLELLKSAAARDPQHVRSRFYLAGEATRAGDFADAKQQWKELLALGKGDEPWLASAQAGLRQPRPGSVATRRLPDAARSRGMVEGLSSRLMQRAAARIDEWTQLVRSRLVLGQARGGAGGL